MLSLPGIGDTRQLVCSGSDIAEIAGKIAKLSLKAKRPGIQCGVVKPGVDSTQVQIADAVAGREGGHLLLVAVDVHDGIRCDGFGVSSGKDIGSGSRVDRGQLIRRDLKAVVDRRTWSRHEPGVDNKWSGAREVVILPDIGRNGHYAAARANE